MFDPDPYPEDASDAESSEGVPEFGPLAGSGEPEPVAASPDPTIPVSAVSAFQTDIPPDNEHGDGVRNPTLQPCAGIKGNGLLTPKVFSKAEDWRDYNYSDFSY